MKSATLFYSLAPLSLEEVLHEGFAVVLQHAFCDGGLGMEGFGGEAGEAPLVVAAAEDDAGELRPADGTGAHHARLHGDVERAAAEVLSAQLVGRRRDGQHLGVGGHVVERLGEVVGAGYDHAVGHDDRSDGYLVGT